jgi:hypothetical protein
MIRHRAALRLLRGLDDRCAPEGLIGDLIEEITEGRSGGWVWSQLLALCGMIVIAGLRQHVQTFHMVVLAQAVFFLGGTWFAPAAVVQTWLVLYFVAGTLSLFGDLWSSRTRESRDVVCTEPDRRSS